MSIKKVKENYENTYQSFVRYAIFILLALSLIGVLAKDKNYNVNFSELKNNTVTIKGEAEKVVAPDTASVSFEITKKASTTKEATEYVNSRIKKLVDMLSFEGINQEDFKTASYNVNPEYNYKEGKRTFSGYRVTQRIDVKIRDLDSVSTILSKINQVEVTNVSGLSFFVDDDTKIKEELRKEAIENSKEKAEKIARDLGVKLEKIVGFSEGQDYAVNNYMSNAMMSKSVVLESADAEATIPVGSNKMTSTVNITYKISN